MKRSDFIQLHAPYDTIAADVIDHVDMIAARATALGGLALGTARLAALACSLDESPLDAELLTIALAGRALRRVR